MSDATPTSASATTGRQRRRRGSFGRRTRQTPVILAAAALGGVAVVYAVLAALQLRHVAADLRQARDAVAAAERLARAGRIDEARDALVRAEVSTLDASGRAHSSPELDILRLIPIASNNVRALTDSIELALQLVTGGRQLLDAARPFTGPNGKLGVPFLRGTIPLTDLQTIRQEIGSLVVQLPGRSHRPSGRFLLPPVASMQRGLVTQAARVRHRFAGVDRALAVLVGLGGANGRQRIFIAVANTAEMRGTGGMILSQAQVSAERGHFKLDRVGPIDNIALKTRATVALPADYERRFGSLGITQEWRNANLIGDFTVAGRVLEAMYATATGASADAVVQVDAQALAAVLRVIGPVNVEGLGEVSADNAVRLVLNEAYIKFPDRPTRQDYMGVLAGAVLTKLLTNDFVDLSQLSTALGEAARQRHIVMHAARPETQRAITQLGIDGGLPGADSDYLALTVQNFSGNKLDYYIDSSLRVTGQVRRSRGGKLNAQIELGNTAPKDRRPTEVFGPYAPGFRQGEYRGLVTLYVPNGVGLTGATGGPLTTRPSLATENGRSIATFGVALQAGERLVVTLHLSVPPRARRLDQLVLVPTPRVRPTIEVIDIDADGGRIRGRLVADHPATLRAA